MIDSTIKEKELKEVPLLTNNDYFRILGQGDKSHLFNVGKFIKNFIDNKIPTKISQLDDSDLSLLRSDQFKSKLFKWDEGNGMEITETSIDILKNNIKEFSVIPSGINIGNVYYGLTKNNRHINSLTGGSGSMTIKSVSKSLYIGFINPHKEPMLVLMEGAMEFKQNKLEPILVRRDFNMGLNDLVFGNKDDPFTLKIRSDGVVQHFTCTGAFEDINFMSLHNDESDPYSQYVDFFEGQVQINRCGDLILKDSIFLENNLFIKYFKIYVDSEGTLVLNGDIKVTGKIN